MPTRSEARDTSSARVEADVAIELSDTGDEPFEAFNAPIVVADADARQRSGRSDDFSDPTGDSSGGSNSGDDDDELSTADEESFTQRYEELNNTVAEPYAPLSTRASLIYGETVTFSEFNVLPCSTADVVLGPEYLQMFAAGALAMAPVLVQTVVLRDAVPIWLHVMTWLSLLVATVFLAWTSTRDPGIVPKRMGTLEPIPPRIRCFVNEKETAGLRYCPTCDVYRGPRTHHCSICGNCVDQFDHHCPWTGTCIGANNYHWFLWYLHAVHLLAAFVVISATVGTINQSIQDGVGIVDALEELYYIPIVLIAFIMLAGVSVTGLMLFHWFLLVRNVTTSEYLKSTYDGESQNPWDLGVAQNVIAKWRGWVDPKTFSWNYQCYVVREIVRREINLLAQERDEEVRLRKERKRVELARQHRNSTADERKRMTVLEAAAEPSPDPPTFVEADTGLYI